MSNQDITVILNVYRRPHTLQKQIDALKKQTIQPKQIIIWKNYYENIEIPETIKKDHSLIIIECSKNLGVWPRFLIGLLANTEYVALFDDDTIPGNKWFENCLNTIQIHNGLLGTVGLIFNNNIQYSQNYWRYGWCNPINETLQVDFVGHAWFLRRIWLIELQKLTPDYNQLLKVGEDMGISWALQQIGINTFVPPHPHNDIEMYGSYPALAQSYGTECMAISLEHNIWGPFQYMFELYKNKGFKFIKSS